MPKTQPFSGHRLYKTTSGKQLIQDLNDKKTFKCSVQIVSSKYLFGFSGHSLVKLHNISDDKLYYMHICNGIFSHPTIINGEDEFKRYLSENNKTSLGCITIKQQVQYHDNLAKSLTKYTEGKLISWGVAYHNCHSFARRTAKKSANQSDEELPIIPPFVPRVPKLALNRYNKKMQSHSSIASSNNYDNDLN